MSSTTLTILRALRLEVQRGCDPQGKADCYLQQHRNLTRMGYPYGC